MIQDQGGLKPNDDHLARTINTIADVHAEDQTLEAAHCKKAFQSDDHEGELKRNTEEHRGKLLQ